MIYLRTGANGTGKTLLTLRDVREKSVKENRPVYHNGRFDLVADFGWQKIDIRDWQAQPDGAIFIVDECHNDFPVRSGKEPAPEYIRMLAEHRRRGFDFYLITQHPLNIDAFVRRLIGSPGWHQHLKRASGAPLVSVIEYNTVNDQCQKAGASASGSLQMVAYPREVYQWYNSTSLDTAKVKIPFQVKLLAAMVVLVPVLAYLGWHSFQTAIPKAKTSPQADARSANQPPAALYPSSPTAPLPVAPIADPASYTPRIDGFPQSAPRYDALTVPTVAPHLAACVSMGDRCDCFTQQATRVPTSRALCLEVVKNGYFMDYGTPSGQPRSDHPITDRQNGLPAS
jgi:zona occludens toxin